MRVIGKHEFDGIPTVNNGDKIAGINTHTSAPDSSNDETQGYYEGYIWVNTTDNRVYFCTDSSTGAAKWDGAVELIQFYVNSNNTNTGDGSKSNPFNSLDSAYNAIVGVGTSINPSGVPFGKLASINVETGTYSTSLNLALNRCIWNFQDYAEVTSTGSCLYEYNDASIGSPTAAQLFYITGRARFTVTGGNLVKVEKTNSTTRPRILFMDIGYLNSTYATGTNESAAPFQLDDSSPTRVNAYREQLVLNQQGDMFSSFGHLFNIGSKGGLIWYGNDFSGRTSTSSQRIVKSRDHNILEVKGNNIFAYNAVAMYQLGGSCRYTVFDSNRINSKGQPSQRYILFDSDFALETTGYDTDLFGASCSIINIKSNLNNLSQSDIIKSDSLSDVEFIHINNCNLGHSTVSSNIKISKSVSFEPIGSLDPQPIVVSNILGNQMVISNVPSDSGADRLMTVNGATGEIGYVDKSLITNSNQIKVTQENVATTLGGTIDSTKEYFIDGIIDLGTTQITVPPTGITLKGYSFDISGLTSSEDNYTMFVSESIPIGSGNVLGTDYFVSVTGAASKVYELYDATGLNAFEFTRVNYIDCTSLGDIYDYRQGLEFGTGRFGGSPSLTLHGLWGGGYRINTSIARNLAGTMTAPLFKEGTLFQMNSRFATDINCDLPTLAALTDFQPSNFPNSSTIQIQKAIITRDGVLNTEDANITPNLSSGDLPCFWKDNNGLNNTYVGGTTSVVVEAATNITVQGQYEQLNAGAWLGTGLEHFTATADGRLQHDGVSPREYEITYNLTLESAANNVLYIKFYKYDFATTSEQALDYTVQARQVNSLIGGRDVAFFVGTIGVTLDKGDQLFVKVMNNSSTTDITAEGFSFIRVQER